MADDDLQKTNREGLLKTKEKSEDDYEKNLMLITSGTLVLSLTFIEKVAPLQNAKGVIALVIAWSLLTLSLIANIISHRISANYSSKHADDVAENKGIVEINRDIAKSNRVLQCFNYWIAGLMILGIVSLVVYCSINAFQMSNLPDKKGENIGKADGLDTIKNGRTISTLVVPKPDSKPADQSPKDTAKKK